MARYLARSAKSLLNSGVKVPKSTSTACRWYNGGVTSSSNPDNTHTVDLRSDVLSVPTPEMRQAMATAPIGDDVFREDPTVNKLQRDVAALFGKEAALFVPSGTMGNLICVLAHCVGRGYEVLLGDKCHLLIWEQAGMAQLGGLQPRAMVTNPDGTFNVNDIEDLFRDPTDIHQPFTKLVCVENTHNYWGGVVLPLDFLASVKQKASEFDLPVHMDGARMMNAAVALKVPPREIVQHVDSVCQCISKGLGAPIGSVIAGTEELINRAERIRKVLGGGMRQVGVLAAAAAIAIEEATTTLEQDHIHAKMLAEGINKNSQGVVDIKLDLVHTNLVMVNILKPGLTAAQFCERLEKVTQEEQGNQKESISVKSLPFDKQLVRLVLHNGINAEDVGATIRKFSYINTELAEK